MLDVSLYFAPGFAKQEPSIISNSAKTVTATPAMTTTNQTNTKTFGAWASYQLPLELLSSQEEQQNAIGILLSQGYKEYYFPISNFELESVRSGTDNLLTSADGTNMKMFAILLPPSESGSEGNYDWEGWIEYLNSLKQRHPSLYGFVIDDFNWFGTDNDNNNGDFDDADDIKYNVNFMIDSDLITALQHKRGDLMFYPLIYIEGVKTNAVKREYYNVSDGIILASADFYNITQLEHNLGVFGKVFDNKTIRYLIYTAPTSRYITQGYNPPSDRLILATLSAVSRANDVNGSIIIWRDTANHAIRDYLSNLNNSKYMSIVSMMEQLQLRDENDTNANGVAAHGNSNTLVTKFSSALLDQQRDEDREQENDDNEKKSQPVPWLGIAATELTSDLAEDRRLPENSRGIAVQSVIHGSPADRAGIKGMSLDVDNQGYLLTRGDVIISIDGKDVKNMDDLLDVLRDKQIGDIVSIDLNRNGKTITNLNVKLEGLPKY
jgi:PDZ domain